MSVDEIKVRAKKLGQTVRLRNLIEYAAAAVVVVLFGRLALTVDLMLVRLGAWWMVGATAFVVSYMHAHSWVPASFADQASLEFCRRELVRQRDVLRGVWWWYLLPFVPGFLLMTIGRVADDPARAPRAAVAMMFALLVFVAIGLLNERAAKKLQRDIDALDR